MFFFKGEKCKNLNFQVPTAHIKSEVQSLTMFWCDQLKLNICVPGAVCLPWQGGEEGAD